MALNRHAFKILTFLEFSTLSTISKVFSQMRCYLFAIVLLIYAIKMTGCRCRMLRIDALERPHAEGDRSRGASLQIY